MNEKQLKLAKLYAELIGVEVTEWQGSIYECVDFGYGPTTGAIFNPFIGQLQLDARDNYQAIVSYHHKQVSLWIETTWITANYKNDIEMSVAVIECILKSKGLYNEN
jgi:hypothetical protein